MIHRSPYSTIGKEMKLFQHLTQRISRWKQHSRPFRRICLLVNRDRLRPLLRSSQFLRLCLSGHGYHITNMKSQTNASYRHPRILKGMLAGAAVLSLTSAIGYRFYNEPQLAVGTTAPERLVAPNDASVEDTKTTEAARQAARTGAIPVLMVDTASNDKINQDFDRLLQRGNDLRQQFGRFPFFETDVLSLPTQRYLQRAEEWEWLAVLSDARQNSGVSDVSPSRGTRTESVLKAPPGVETAQAPAEGQPTPSPTPPPHSDLVGSRQLATLELRNYRRSQSNDDLQLLVTAVNRARDRYQGALQMLRDEATDSQSPLDASLFNLTDVEWEQTRTAMRHALDRILLQGIAPGLPNGLLEQAIQAQIALEVPDSAHPLAVSWLMHVARPNLVQDPEQTRLRAEQAAEAVQPEMVEVRRGEVIVAAGEAITQADFVLLDYFGLSRRRTNPLALAGFAGLISGAIALFLTAERMLYVRLRLRDHILILLLVLTTPLAIALGLPGSSLPAVGLLIGSFYGSALSITVIALLGIVLPVGMDVALNSLIASAVGSAVGAVLSGRLRSREELALLGLGVGLTQGVVYLILSLMFTASTSPVWYAVLTVAGLQSLLGIAWSIIALGISPYLEHAFDLVTPTRLVELANPNRPLLKRLASEAPGTFQHTLFVATLAEAAARALGCNVELVRTGTLYHDIGKMHDAEGFIENQMGGPNKHDSIGDPWVSAAIIKKHVTEGIAMARRCRLPRAVRAFIPEHQGTMLITYFYYQAQERAKENPELVVREEDFRYDGPTPQSRETGIVMLADSCEAALRSLKDATPQEALATVNKIMRHRWQDNQLTDSGLTRADLTKIAEIFVQVWQQFNHKRIPYPKAALNPPSASSVSTSANTSANN